MLDARVMSFSQWNPNPAATSPFNGLGNYTQALSDPIFWQAFGNVLYYTVVTVIGQMVLGLAVALLLNRKLFALGFFRALYYLPVVTSPLFVPVLFPFLFSPPSSPVPCFPGAFLHLIPDTHLCLT